MSSQSGRRQHPLLQHDVAAVAGAVDHLRDPRVGPDREEEVGPAAEGSPEGSLSEWAEQTPSRRPSRTGAAKHAVREAARSAAEKINIADADTNAEEDPPAKKGALRKIKAPKNYPTPARRWAPCGCGQV